KLAYVFDYALKIGSIPSDIELSTLQRLFNLFKTNARAVRRYTPRAYPGSVVYFTAKERKNTDQGPSALGVERLIKHVEIYTVPGSHYTMLREPHVSILAERLRTCIAASTKGVWKARHASFDLET